MQRRALNKPSGEGRAQPLVYSGHIGGILPLFVAVFLMRFAFSLTVVSLQYIVQKPSDLGVISSAYPIMEMIFGLALGALSDRLGRKWIIVLGLAFSSLVSVSFTFSSSTIYLTLVHALQGICAAAIIVSSLALLTDLAKLQSRGRTMGAYDFSTIIGYGAGFFLALILINGNSENSSLPFLVGAGISILGGVFAAVVLKDSKGAIPKLESLRESLRKVSKSKSAISLLPTWFVFMIFVGSFLTFTRRLLQSLDLSPFTRPGTTNPVSSTPLSPTTILLGAIVIIGGAILLGFSQTTFGSLSDKYGRSKISTIGQVSLAGMLATLIVLIGFHERVIFALPLILLFGAGILAFTPAALAELSDVAPESGRGSTMGLYSISIGAGTAFGPLAIGVLSSSFGFETGISIVYGIGVAIIVVFSLIRALPIGSGSRNIGENITKQGL